MQEGILALMQMPRTTVAVQMLKEAGCPISSCSPTHHRGRHGLLRHAGRRADRRARRADLLRRPAGDRTDDPRKTARGVPAAEYLLEHGMLDRVVPPRSMRDELITSAAADAAMPPASRATFLPPPRPRPQGPNPSPNCGQPARESAAAAKRGWRENDRHPPTPSCPDDVAAPQDDRPDAGPRLAAAGRARQPPGRPCRR